jgi:nicotinate-nucleotide pyrophosphorylase (carboxylating)
MTSHFRDGQRIKANQTILTVRGPAQALLAAERISLNFLQHLSGIATLTAKFCEAIRGFPTKILDTRKTTPGLRHLQKWAVRLGGGHNHRFSLGDGILIKDNHLSLLSSKKIGIPQACRLAREHGPHHMRISVETESLTQVKEALKGQADIILLDNMKPPLVRKAVELIKGRALVEISGGITLTNVRDMAAAGAQYISIGALTHSAPAVNIHMEFLGP